MDCQLSAISYQQSAISATRTLREQLLALSLCGTPTLGLGLWPRYGNSF
ncbi:MAG: hypothetical protein F6K26_33355 [Moorea sp. SIO2I5]|nr:hypothetical protein [Moorena sp. SIO2I5]